MGQGYSSNSGIFAKRGDPWVSRREGIRDFRRDPDNENPDYDFDHRYHGTGNIIGRPIVAPPRPICRDPVPEKKRTDTARTTASICRRMNAAIHRHEEGFAVGEAPSRVFKPCGGCRSAFCVRQGVCRTSRGLDRQ